MKTFKQLMVEAEGFQGKFTPSHDTKQQAIEVGKKVNPSRTVKKGAPLALRPASKAASIVRTKQGGTGKEAVGAPKKSGPGVPQSRPKGPGSKTYERQTPERKKGGDIVPYQKKEKTKKGGKDNQFGKGFNRNMGVLSTHGKTRDKAWRKVGHKTAQAIKDSPGNLAKAIKNAPTTQDGPAESGSGSSGIQAAKRGVYNG